MSPARAARRGDSKCARGHARRRHHEDVERQALARVEQPVHAVDAEHVGDLVRVADDRRRPARHHRARELGGRELGRLDVDVGVDEARARGSARPRRSARRRSYAPTPAIRPSAIATSPSSHSRVKAENTRAPSITRSGSASPRATAIRCARLTAAPAVVGAARAPASARGPVAARTAATTAGVEEIVGGSPTPRRPYGASGSPSSRTSSSHRRHVEHRRDQVVGERRVADQRRRRPGSPPSAPARGPGRCRPRSGPRPPAG